MVSVTGSSRGEGRGGRELMRELLLNLPAAVAYVSGPGLVYEFANEEYRRSSAGVISSAFLCARLFRNSRRTVLTRCSG